MLCTSARCRLPCRRDKPGRPQIGRGVDRICAAELGRCIHGSGYTIRVRTFVCFDSTDLIVGAQRLATRPKSSRNEPSSVLVHIRREVCHTYTLHAGVRPADEVLYGQQSGDFDSSMGSAGTASISENILRGRNRRSLYVSHLDVQVAGANTVVREGIRHATAQRSGQPQGRGSSSNHTHRSVARASPSRLSGHSTTTPKTAHDRERCWDGEWSLKLRRSYFGLGVFDRKMASEWVTRGA